MTNEVAGDLHHVAYTRMKNGKIESISSKGFNPSKDKALRVHVGKPDTPKMKHVGHVSSELEHHVVSDPKTKQPFTAGPVKEIYEENDLVMIHSYDSDEVLKRYFSGKNFEDVVQNDVKELQQVGDLSRSNSDEVADYVRNHYNEHVSSLGFVQSIIPASENETGEDLYGVVSMSDHDADGNHHVEDDEGEKLNRNHLHYYKASDLLPADPDEQGDHGIKKAKGTPKPDHKYIRREVVNGEYRYIYELPNGEHAAFDEEAYLNWVKGKRDEILSGQLKDAEGFSTWRDPETGELNLSAIEELDDGDLVAYGGAIAQNYNHDEWIDHLQDQISMQDAESIKPALAKSDEQINHLGGLLEQSTPQSIATAKNKTAIELAAVHMDASGMLMRERNGKIHPDQYILDRFNDGFLEASDETKKLADVLSDYIKKTGSTDLNMKNIKGYQPKFRANPEFDDMFHLTAFESLKMLASINDRDEGAQWERGEVQQSLARGKNLIDKGELNIFLSQEDKNKELEVEKTNLLKEQRNRKFKVPNTINTSIEGEAIEPKFFQNEMVNWTNAVGYGINGSDTGQGKTFQAILSTESAIAEGRAEGSIIFAPISIQAGWGEEIEKFVKDGEDHHIILSKSEAIEALSNIQTVSKKYVILPYSLFQGDMNDPTHRSLLQSFEALSANRLLFFDEGQGLRNEDTQIYKSLDAVIRNTRGTIILNATPMAGNPRNLHSQMAILQPGLLPEWQEFKSLYTVPLVDEGGREIDVVWDEDKVNDLFENTLKPYINMRYNDDPEIAKAMNLPEKREESFRATMTGYQKELYDAVVNDMLSDLINKPFDSSSVRAMDNKHSLLRQISFHPRMVQGISDDPEVIEKIENATSAKWENALDGLRVHFKSENDKVFAGEQRVPMGAMIPIAQVKLADHMADYFSEQLGLERHEVGIIRGSVPTDERERIRRAFNTGEIKLLILGQQAAGYGLNAQKNSNYIAELDDGWDANTRKQYLARVIRMGNKAPHVSVHVHRDPESYDGITQQMIVDKGRTNFMFVGDRSTTPVITTEDSFLQTMMGVLKANNMTLDDLNRERAKSGLPPHKAPEALSKALNEVIEPEEGLSTLEMLLLGYSQPLARAKMGQERWNEIKALLYKKAHRQGITLPDYFEEEEVADLDRDQSNLFEEDKLWMTS